VEPRRRESAAPLISAAGQNPAPKANFSTIHPSAEAEGFLVRWVNLSSFDICGIIILMAQAKKQETVFIGKCNFRGNEKVFGIKTKDRRQHTYVIGKTGTGKTALLKNIALQDIRAGRGIGIIDPHGEFVEEVLSQIPKERMKDVIYFNPVDAEYPIGFNILEVTDPKYKHLVVSDLLGIFTKIWANVWSARMEYILQNCIMALLDTPGTTLLGIPRILVDKDYRQQIVANVKDPVVKSFWVHEYETWRDQFRNEAIVPIQNKVNQFLNTSFIRNIVGQPKSTLNIPQIMNEGKILLVNVSKGRIGEDNSSLLGAMIITKVQLAAMERVRIPEEERHDFYLYVDEFQNFATDSFASILSEARKYHFNIIIAHQYVGQLVTDISTKVRDAVFGNVGTMIAFRVGAADAEYLENEFAPEFAMQDLINLPNYCIYLKLMVDGVTSRPFSAVTIPPLQFETDPSIKEKILKLSRERYSQPRVKVEEEIARWSGLGGGLTAAGEEGKTYETICWNCGKTATVPFKPDGKRPVYCQPCLKQIEEGKIVPLPERMPQVGRTKFAPSLEGLGIEFGGGGEKQQTKAGEGFSGRSLAGRPMRPTPPFERNRQKSIIHSKPIPRVSGGMGSISLSELASRAESQPASVSEKKEDKESAVAKKPQVDVAGLRKILEDSLKSVSQKETKMKLHGQANDISQSTLKPAGLTAERNPAPKTTVHPQASSWSSGARIKKGEEKQEEKKKVIKPGERVKF